MHFGVEQESSDVRKARFALNEQTEGHGTCLEEAPAECVKLRLDRLFQHVLDVQVHIPAVQVDVWDSEKGSSGQGAH